MEMSDEEKVNYTVLGEASNQGDAGMKAVLNVIANRVRSPGWPNDWGDVCWQPGQFSCWSTSPQNAANRARMLRILPTEPVYRRALALTRMAMAGHLPDATNGATHYVTADYYADRAHWASWLHHMEITARIGDHVFLREKKR